MHNYLTSGTVAELKANALTPRHDFFDAITRCIDFLVALLAIVVFGPLMVAIAITIKLNDRGPIFFRQDRLGKWGKPFSIIKFRSMVVNAERAGAKWRIEQKDPRITRIGQVLRMYHLDELPQLFNVLFGEMSLVGPRPALIFQKDYYEEWEMARLAVTPGMTGLSQVSGGNSLNWDERIVIDVYYARHRNFRLYLFVLLRTALQIFFKKGIYTAEGTVKGWTRPVPDWYMKDRESLPSEDNSTSYA